MQITSNNQINFGATLKNNTGLKFSPEFISKAERLTAKAGNASDIVELQGAVKMRIYNAINPDGYDEIGGKYIPKNTPMSTIEAKYLDLLSGLNSWMELFHAEKTIY